MLKKVMLILACLLIFLGPIAPDVYVPESMEKAQLNTVKVYYHYEYTDVTGEIISLVSRGSGIIIGENKILTCAHMVTDKPVGKLYIPTRIPIPLEIVKVDPKVDLLLAEFEFELSYDFVSLADNLSLGEDIMFTGFSSLSTPLLRFGKVAMNSWGIMVHPVFFGDSGGGVFNLKGELVGIIYCTILVQKDDVRTATLIGYAIPLDTIKGFLDEEEGNTK